MTEAGAEGPEEIVARTDPDRYVAALFAPPGRRRSLIALYLFNGDIARIRNLVHEPLVGHIRLSWWREQIAAVYEGRASAAPLADLREAIATFSLPRDLFEAYLDARGLDFNEAPFADEAALEAYTVAIAGTVMKLAARICGAGGAADQAAHHAALAVAYAGFIRSLRYDTAHRFCRLPLDWLAEAGLGAEDVFANPADPKLAPPVSRLAESAKRHLKHARSLNIPRASLAALAPAVLTQAYLNRATPFPGGTFEPSQIERVARLAVAMLTRRI